MITISRELTKKLDELIATLDEIIKKYDVTETQSDDVQCDQVAK